MKHAKILVAAILVVLAAGFSLSLVLAQDGPGSQSSETVARPKKKDAPPPDPDSSPAITDASPASTADSDSTDEPKIPSKFTHKDKDVPDTLPTFHSDVSTVQLDIAVLDNKGHFIPNIPRANFRVLEDNVPQQIGTFSANADAPMTIAMVIEFSNLYQQYWSQGWAETLTAAYGFVQTLKADDYVAVIAYDMRSDILSDFTTDRSKTGEALQRLRIAGFSEANLFDALVDTEQRMTNIEGRKAILLIASGRDTFSKLTYDKARKAIQEAAVPVYAISLLQASRIMAEPYMGSNQRMDFLASRQPNDHVRPGNRRPSLLPAILRRVSWNLSVHLHCAAKPILDHLSAFQSGQGRKVPHAESGPGGSRQRQPAQHQRERQAGEVHGYRQAGLYGPARSRVAARSVLRSLQKRVTYFHQPSQDLFLASFQSNKNSLTV